MNIKVTTLALSLATLGLLGACSNTNDDAPATGGDAAGNAIAIVPNLAAPTWTDSGAGTRAENPMTIRFAEGGKIVIKMYQTDPNDYQQNTFAIDATGKMVRIPYVSGSGDNEADLCVKTTGNYHFAVSGEARCKLYYLGYNGNPTDPTNLFVPLTVSLTHPGATEVSVDADGKVTLNCTLASAGITLGLRDYGGVDYTRGDVSVLLDPALKDINDASASAIAITASDSYAAWGNLAARTIAKDAEMMRLTVGVAPATVTTYKVLAPKTFSLQAGRMICLYVTVGGTGISVQMKDGNNTVTDFVVQPVTNAVAEKPGTYNGVQSPKLAIAGQTPYWVAPVNVTIAAGTLIKDIDFANACPAGWHVPTKAEFEAMTGAPQNPINTNSAAVWAAFGPVTVNTYYISSVLNYNYPALFVYADKDYRISSVEQTDAFDASTMAVRCVQKAN